MLGTRIETMEIERKREMRECAIKRTLKAMAMTSQNAVSLEWREQNQVVKEKD